MSPDPIPTPPRATAVQRLIPAGTIAVVMALGQTIAGHHTAANFSMGAALVITVIVAAMAMQRARRDTRTAGRPAWRHIPRPDKITIITMTTFSLAILALNATAQHPTTIGWGVPAVLLLAAASLAARAGTPR